MFTNTQNSKKLMAVFLAGMLVMSAGLGGVVAAAATVIDDPTEINHDAKATHNPEIPVTVDKDVHKMGWGTLKYEDDSGSLVSPDAHVNGSAENPIGLTATDIQFDDHDEFPRYNASHSTLDATEWSVTGANSSEVTVTNTTTAPNVEAVNIATGGAFTSGDTATAEYALSQSIDSDESKRSVQLFADVTTLDSSTHVEIRVVDEDGDYKTALIDPDNSSDSMDVVAGTTGEGFVLQQQMGDLTTTTVAGSDGTFDNIAAVNVVVQDGDFDGSFSVMNAEKLGTYTLGEQKYDSDGDGELDSTRTVTEPSGQYFVTGFDTFGSTFDLATVHGAQIDAIWDAKSLDEKHDARIEFTDDTGDSQSYPSFEFIVDSYYRIQLPSAYDLSYSNAALEDTVELPSGRYQTVEYAEGVSDTKFSNISTWNDVTSSYSSQGADVTLDSSIQPGQEIAIHHEYVVTDSEKSAMENVASAAPGQFAEEEEGFIEGIPLIGEFLASILSVLGIGVGGKWAMGK